MASNIRGIDHVIIGVLDLDRARATFENLGFQPTPRGRHVGSAAGEHCLMFANSHIELRGTSDAAQPDEELEAFLATGEGLLEITLASTDAEGTANAWRAAGLAPAAVAGCGRVIEPDLELHCWDVTLDAEATGGVRLGACAHDDPAAMRRPDWLAHPNGAVAIGSVTVVVDDPGAMAEPMAKVFGSTSLTETDDTLAVHTGRGVILFVNDDDLTMLHPEVDPSDDGPSPAALTLLVPDLGATAAFLDHQGIPYRRDVSGALGIAPEHGHGVMLEFAAA